MTANALATCLCVGSLVAQTAPNTCDVKRNNEPWFYTSTSVDAGTGRAYNHGIYQPPAYWSQTAQDPGVPAGSRTWRWIPSAVNMRRETRQVTGFYVYLRPSAVTVSFPTTGYIPEWRVHAPKLGGATPAQGYVPDLQKPVLHQVPQVSFPFAQHAAVRARSTFSQAVPVHAEEVCFSFGWQGGEHRLKAGAQGFVGTSQESPWAVPTWGQIDATGQVSVADPLGQVGQYTTLWGSYYEEAPVLIVESDFAHQRMPPPQAPAHSGFNDAAGRCDLGSQAVRFGWNVDGGTAHAGAYVLPLTNLRTSIFSGTSSWLGHTLEVDLTDPALTTLADISYVGTMDAQGFFDGPRVVFPALTPSAVGWFLGVECVVIDSGLSTILATTQAHWIEVIQ